jgi:hypothetical protein
MSSETNQTESERLARAMNRVWDSEWCQWVVLCNWHTIPDDDAFPDLFPDSARYCSRCAWRGRSCLPSVNTSA